LEPPCERGGAIRARLARLEAEREPIEAREKFVAAENVRRRGFRTRAAASSAAEHEIRRKRYFNEA